MRTESFISRLRALASRLRGFFSSRRLDRDFQDEVSSHLSMLEDENLRRGLAPNEARRQARLRLGAEAPLRESQHDLRGLPWLESLLQDIRFGLRMLRKSPGFTAVAIFTLALGIGANTAIFTMINGLMLHTLPVRDPGQLIELLHHYPGEPEPGFNGFSWDAYRIMRDSNHVFSDFIIGSMNFLPVRGDKLPPQTVFGGTVGSNFFQGLGVQPAAGRLIGPEDVHVGYHAPVAVVSWSFWKSRFDLDPGIIGKKIVIGNDAATIIGVAQRGFYGLSDEAPQDIWWPTSLGPSQGWGSLGLLARLKPGVSIKKARSEMSVLFQEAVNQPDAGPFVRGMKLRIEPARNGITTPLTQMLSTPLTVLMATVGLLLFLACANLAGLLLARGASRQHEMAVRACLGAARARLLRQTLTESLLLSVAGTAVGVFLAYFAAHALIRVFASGRFVIGAPVRFEALTMPDVHVLLFTGGIALLTAFLCGAAPAMSASNTAPASALRQTARIGESKSGQLFGKGLVASQVALSLVLVSSAGLFVGYLSHLRSLNLGFERNNLLLVTLDFAHTGYTPSRFAQRSRELIVRLDAIPGVSSATFSGTSPMEGPGAAAFAFAEGHPEKGTQVNINYVAPDYFETYGTPFIVGRDFSARDQAGSTVAIINEAAARDCFGNENPIGRQITLSHITLTKGEKTYDVVGVVGDAKYNDLQRPAPPTIYPDLLQQGFTGSQLAIRTKIDPGAVASAVRQAEAAVLNAIPIVRITTMNEQIDSSIVPQRLIAMLSAGFGGLGALLAAIGLYGLLAYTVARRTHEIGVRMALGATSTDVMRMVLRDALYTVGTGLVLGAPLALCAESVAGSLIRDLPAKSPVAIALGGAVMIALGPVAAYIPARRATRIDPMAALRHE
jgi:predicted permease